MSLVGPRPLPVDEGEKLTDEQQLRTLVKPEITSTWVVESAHGLKFSEWMKKDLRYVEVITLTSDIVVFVKTLAILLKL